jgi:hypothetical protein
LVIDPLIRNINRDPVIRSVEMRTKITKSKEKCKVGAFADNVNAICVGDRRNVWRVFEQSEKLTPRSGLKLNAEKTEMLASNTGRVRHMTGYCRKKFEIKTVKELKICGQWYCNDIEREYRLNIMVK